MNSDKNEIDKLIKEVDEYNKNANNPSYWTSGKQTLPIKSKSKLGLTVTGILGIIFTIIFSVTAKTRLDYQSIFSLLVIFLISTILIIKAFRM